MAQLAIRGHATRGKEVIQLLEMLGGKSNSNMNGYNDDLYYFIAKDGLIYGSDIEYEELNCKYTIFTLEEFLEKFPYKVGDKVTLDKSPCIITEMYWDYDDVIYYVSGDDFSKGVYSTDKDLQPYKEETMEEPKELIIGFIKDDNGDWVLDIHKDYEIKETEGKFKVIKKQPQYPKTYEECCEVLGILDNRGFGFINLSECENTLMSRFIQLKRCRDAYWKIAGKQLGLDKHWEPDWNNGHVEKYYIYLKQNEIEKSSCFFESHFLAFPTAEMRDAFFENFKDLIEECKELL